MRGEEGEWEMEVICRAGLGCAIEHAPSQHARYSVHADFPTPWLHSFLRRCDRWRIGDRCELHHFPSNQVIVDYQVR